MKATMQAEEALRSTQKARELVQGDIKKIDAELDHVNKILMQAEATDDLKKRAKDKAKALETSLKAAFVISQRLLEVSRQLATVPASCEVELSTAEMMLFAYGEKSQ